MILYSHNDPKRWLNLNFAEIYVLLNADEYKTFQPRVQALNNNPAVRRGLFNITAVQRGKEMNSALPDSIKEMLTGFNVIVRLVDSIHGIYTYGIGSLNTSADDATWDAEFEDFSKQVCETNLRQLEILESRNTSTAIGAQQLYESMNLRRSVFEQAQQGTLGEDENFRFAESNDILRVSDAICSREVIESAVDAVRPDVISLLRSRPTRDDNSQLSVRVHLVGRRVHFEFRMYDKTVDIVFKGHSEDFLYAALLKSVTLRKSLNKESFNRTDDSSVKWLQELHASLGYDYFSTEISNMQGNRRHEAKSNINKKLRSKLHKLSSTAYNICQMKLTRGLHANKYDVGILSQCIFWDLPPRTTPVWSKK